VQATSQDHILFRGACVLPEDADEAARLVAQLTFRGVEEDDDDEKAPVKRLAELTRRFRSRLQLQGDPCQDADGANLGMFLPEWGEL
jgi:hypothetical protein